MIRFPEIPRAALAAGLPARYLYWYGRSGRRYLFTATGGAPLADFGRGVAIVARARTVLRAVDLEELARGARPAAGEVYVHLLPRSPAERRAVIADLAPAAEPRYLRLAA